MNPFRLEQTHDNEITHLIHISDLHVRAGDQEKARITEYTHVFNNFVTEIKEESSIINKTALIVISGDIFHNKTYVGVEGVTILFEFISELLNLAPVIVISGNHDSLQQDVSKVDSLDMIKIAFSDSNKPYNFYYLKETGLYEYGNVGIGVVSIREVLRRTAGSGKVDELPKYPDPGLFGERVNIKVALFHGTVYKNSTTIGYPIEWFAGYDFGVFGDVHRQQIHNTNGFIWGYPGSLIQQDNGESTNGHGYIRWSIKDKIGVAYDIPNDYGFITMQQSDKEWHVKFAPRNIKVFSEAIKDPIFPKFPKIRFIGNRSELLSLLEKSDKIPSLLQNTTSLANPLFEEQEETDMNLETNISKICDMNNKESWIRYIKDIYPDIDVSAYIDKPLDTILITCDEIFPDEIKSKIKSRNEGIRKAIEKYESFTIESIGTEIIRFKYIEWDYILCYGKGNYINFESLENKITLINGQNATGKSAFLDVITLGLYGEPTSVRTQINMGKTMSSKIIHDQKPPHEGSNISIVFSYGHTVYEIRRQFNTQSKDESRINTYKLTVYEIRTDDKTRKVIAEMAVATEWIQKHLGTIQNLELSNMMCQIDINNFFMQSNETQKDILERSMNMESITAYSEIIAESIRAYKYICDALKTFKSGMTEYNVHKVTLDDIKQHDKLLESISELNGKLKEIETRRMKLGQKLTNNENEEDALLDDKTIDKKINKLHETLEKLDISDIDQMKIIEDRGRLMTELKKINEILDAISISEADDEDYSDPGEEPKCNMSIETIETMQSNYNKWETLQNREWLDNPDSLIEEIDLIEAKIQKYQEQIDYVEKMGITRPIVQRNAESIKLAAGDIEKTLKNLNQLKTRQIDLLKNRIIPCRIEGNKKQWEDRYKKWRKQIGESEENAEADKLKHRLSELKIYTEKIEKKQVRMEEIIQRLKDLEKEIKSIDLLPFNPNCEACQQQTHRKRHVIITTESKELQKELSKLKKGFQAVDKTELEDMYKEIAELPVIIKQREFYESTQESMNEELKAWEKAEEEWKQEVATKTELENLEVLICQDEWNVYDAYKRIVQKSKKAIDENKDLLQKMREFMRDYEKYTTDYKIIEDNLQSINEWKLWNVKKIHYDYKQTVRDKERLEKELADIQSVFNRIEEYDSLKKDYNYWKNIKVYKEYLKTSIEYSETGAKLQELQKKCAILGKSIQDAESHKLRISDIVELYEKLQVKYELLQKIQKCIIGDTKHNISGFRHWIFMNNALPLIESEINGFLRDIDTIEVRIAYNGTGFIYTIDDRGNQPTINTISGYQRFIINIAMRIALAKMNNKVRLNTLFIDEGFTSFDSINITKIRDILSILLKRFNNILIVSHMDEVRNVVDTSISIKRASDDKQSIIQFGEILEKYKKETPVESETPTPVVKKKGRPKKQ